MQCKEVIIHARGVNCAHNFVERETTASEDKGRTTSEWDHAGGFSGSLYGARPRFATISPSNQVERTTSMGFRTIVILLVAIRRAEGLVRGDTVGRAVIG